MKYLIQLHASNLFGISEIDRRLKFKFFLQILFAHQDAKRYWRFIHLILLFHISSSVKTSRTITNMTKRFVGPFLISYRTIALLIHLPYEKKGKKVDVKWYILVQCVSSPCHIQRTSLIFPRAAWHQSNQTFHSVLFPRRGNIFGNETVIAKHTSPRHSIWRWVIKHRVTINEGWICNPQPKCYVSLRSQVGCVLTQTNSVIVSAFKLRGREAQLEK